MIIRAESDETIDSLPDSVSIVTDKREIIKFQDLLE